MIQTLFVMFFQAVAGEPEPAPAAVTVTPPAQPESAAPVVTETPEEARLRELRARRAPVCRNMPVSGSRLPKRVCASESQMATTTTDSRAWIDRVQSQMPTKY